MTEAPTAKVGAGEKVYHFAGGNEYLPCSVVAASEDEAVKLWEVKRQPTPAAGSEEKQ